MDDAFLTPALAFGDLLDEASAFARAGVSIVERSDVGVSALLVRKGRHTAFTERVQTLWGLTPPSPTRASFGEGLCLIHTAPGVWLAVKDDAGPFWASTLADEFAGIASISDQSSAYGLLRLNGAGARDLLQRGVAIDLHPGLFSVGAAAVTDIDHVGIILWANAEGGFDLAAPRSMASSLRHWLNTTAHAAAYDLERNTKPAT